MSADYCEAEVSAVDYVGPHTVRPGLYEIALTLGGAGGRLPGHLTLLFRPAEAALLAHLVRSNPPTQPDDHLATDLERLQT